MTTKQVLIEMLTDPVFYAGAFSVALIISLIWGIGKL